jgi:integrase
MVHFGETRLTDIKQKELDAAALALFPTAQPETRNRQCYTPFIAVWNHAVKNGWAEVRMWQRPRKPKGTNVVRLKSERSGQRPVDYERAAAFVAKMSPAPAMLMTALFYTGLRPIEAFALTGADVDLVGRWLVVRKSKTGEPRGVPLHSFLCEWLAPLVERAKDGGALFRTPRGQQYTEVQDGGGGLKTAISGARRRSGIKDVSPYTGRHTVSTGLVIAGVHPHVKDQILGHAVSDMSRHYTNVPQAPLIEAIDKLPVPGAWRKLPWLAAPQEWWSRLAEGTGKRTDLERAKG